MSKKVYKSGNVWVSQVPVAKDSVLSITFPTKEKAEQHNKNFRVID